MAGEPVFATPALHHFLTRDITEKEFLESDQHLDIFCSMDDSDILASVKVWQQHKDKVLSDLCKMIILRKLYKVMLSSQSLASNLEEKREEIRKAKGLTEDELKYYVFGGTTSNSTYNINDERIRIETKSGAVKNITEIDDSMVNQALAKVVHKNYICYAQ
jgi:hypothetical protein